MNENIGGHTTLHGHLRRALAEVAGVSATFFAVPERGRVRRLTAAAVPGLSHLDLDLAPLRDHVAASTVVRRHLPNAPGHDVLHVYTQQIALLSAGLLARQPTVVGTDATTAQSAYLLPYRAPTRFTPVALRVGQRLERRVYDAATIVVAQSDWARRSMIDDYGIDPERIYVVRYGITIDDVPDVAPDDPPTIIWVGRSLERKGGTLLIDLWRRRLRHDARLVLVTPEPVPSEPGLTVINDLTIDQVERRNRLLAAASVFVYPSDMDTFGYAPIEAMAMGTPVITYRATAMAETVHDGDHGYLVEPGDTEGLGDAIEKVLADPSRAATFGAAARDHVLATFDARVTTAALVDACRTAIDRFEPR